GNVVAVRVRRIVTGRGGGRSVGPYASFNLGGAGGDEQKAVVGNRSRLATADTAETDGIVTTASGLGLAVLAADCVPLLAADPSSDVIGAAHAGRVGA